MEKKYYQKPNSMIVKFVHHPLLNNDSSSPNTGQGANSRELRRAWKDED